MPRLPKFERSGRKGKNSAQSSQPDPTTTPKDTRGARFLGFLGIKPTSRSPSPRPPSSASREATATSAGQSEQRKPSNSPQNHDDIITVAAEPGNRQEIGRGSPKQAPEAGNFIVATSGRLGKAKIERGPNEQQQQVASHGPDDKWVDTGNKGDMGNKGGKGSKGDTGNKGEGEDKKDKGDKEGKEDKEDRGDQGDKGDQGEKGLWVKAYDKLPDELKQHLAVDKQQTLEDVLKTAMNAKEANIVRRLKLKWGGREIDVQDTADRLVSWITKFKEVGDIAMQYDPVHAALPWAGVRFILLVRCNI